MYNSFKIALLFTVTLLITSCGSDRQNELEFNGQTLALTGGIIESYGENSDGSFDWDVSLYGGSLVINTQTQEATGSGPILYMDLNTNSSTGLVAGTYTYEDGPRAAFIMVDGVFSDDFEASTETGQEFEITQGTVEIELDGAESSFDFDFVDSQGNSIKGYYKGILDEF